MKKANLLKDKIFLMANSDIENKHEKLSELLTEFYKYCYENDLDANRILNIFELGPLSYIIDSEPLVYELNEVDVANAFKHLHDVNVNIKHGISDGISQEEAILILNWDIQNARKSLARSEKDFPTSSLTGCCGYAQSITLLPFIEVGLEVTINNANYLPGAVYRHAFGTVKIPIKINDTVITKQYLLDASYRQFFTTAECNPGRYYIRDYDAGPAAGYYVCQTEEGRIFAKELLTNGFIELTEENAKTYGNGFACESLNLETLQAQEIITKFPGKLYIDSINNSQEKELNNDKEELEQNGDIIVPPGISGYRKM